MVWLTATRTAKLLPHLWYRPQDIIYVPAFILFGYYFAIMKLYALCTLHETAWGTRTGIGDIAAATAAMDKQAQAQGQGLDESASKRPIEKIPLAFGSRSDSVYGSGSGSRSRSRPSSDLGPSPGPSPLSSSYPPLIQIQKDPFADDTHAHAYEYGYRYGERLDGVGGSADMGMVGSTSFKSEVQGQGYMRKRGDPFGDAGEMEMGAGLGSELGSDPR
ncbi:hypothetical protein D9758_016256 [Tetrapyrgos nigripes]|uniref:Uncharacterized protein n=1 Tax=Tetrapyrgos nigripes TaxID=182062 RepID=A0A8H5BYU1_9AGAR|nr:hypothetical protein D9758_016256 [Tetrapyrgos nigripes]